MKGLAILITGALLGACGGDEMETPALSPMGAKAEMTDIEKDQLAYIYSVEPLKSTAFSLPLYADSHNTSHVFDFTKEAGELRVRIGMPEPDLYVVRAGDGTSDSPLPEIGCEQYGRCVWEGSSPESFLTESSAQRTSSTTPFSMTLSRETKRLRVVVSPPTLNAALQGWLSVEVVRP